MDAAFQIGSAPAPFPVAIQDCSDPLQLFSPEFWAALSRHIPIAQSRMDTPRSYLGISMDIASLPVNWQLPTYCQRAFNSAARLRARFSGSRFRFNEL